METTRRTVVSLAGMTGGCWLVTTQGDTHLWDLDNRTCTRLPGVRGTSGGFEQDGVAVHIGRVARYPSVGRTSLLFYKVSWDPPYTERFWESSTVAHIERLAD